MPHYRGFEGMQIPNHVNHRNMENGLATDRISQLLFVGKRVNHAQECYVVQG